MAQLGACVEMRFLEVPISAYSFTDDFHIFNNQLPATIKGDVRIGREMERKPDTGGVVFTGRQYYIWRSIKAKIDSDDPEGSLHRLLITYEGALKELVEMDVVDLIRVHFSVTYHKWEEVRGFIFEPDTINLIAKYRADFYIDNYCHFGEKSGDLNNQPETSR